MTKSIQDVRTLKRKDFIVPCSNTNCLYKDCPNYSSMYKKNSFFFPDCPNNPNKHL